MRGVDGAPMTEPTGHGGVRSGSVEPAGPRARASMWSRLRFVLTWVIALGLVGVGLPKAVNISWHGVLPVLTSLHWTALIGLVGLWVLGLYVHSFVLTAAAPSLTHRRALTLNVTGSAVSNVVPLGGAAGVELNRRMMRAWGIDGRTFTGFAFLTNLWDVGSKLLLPVIAVIALANAGEVVSAPLRLVALAGGAGFVVLVAIAGTVLVSPSCTMLLGRFLERMLRAGLRLVGRTSDADIVGALLEIRRDCAHLVANGWLRMSIGMAAYVALQGALLGFCLHLTGSGNTWVEMLAGFAVERALTILPLTPGGVGVADLGLVGVLLALGGDPTGVAAAAVLYRVFIFALEIPVGGGVFGLWLLGRQNAAAKLISRTSYADAPYRIAHVTDVFLPRLGGIETHIDELVRQQRGLGRDAVVFTPSRGTGDDPAWVRRTSTREARKAITDFDVVHAHVSVLSPYSIAVARAAMSAGVPTLITVHSMWSGAGGIIRLAALAGLHRWPVVWSAVSGAAAETLRRPLGGAQVQVLPNAVDVSSWRRPRAHDNVVVADPAQGDDPITLVSVMRLMARKRPVQLLKTFEQVRTLAPQRDVRLLIIGDGPQRARMERFIQRHGLAPYVEITGRIPREEVLDRLLSASVYVAPAPKESFGIAALEARCAGLPVVAMRHSGVVEFIRDRVDGILVGDDAEMAVALAELVVDEDLRGRLSTHNRRIAPAFDWSDVLDRTDSLYVAAQDAAVVRHPALPDTGTSDTTLALEA